ncbi:ABC-2 type transport system permease protein [Paenibacillus catalpae]|uniref:ABC-2 type transport system permease protein n=1 Tax=Paenibacillus catalpae TaxID=1045775 RepID=A0A1I1TEZ2_9BACL|nr:ABC transporter permease [Paenibacillus catalpae]SFD57152.1 ABC-2 type transport system permease protein [Paenibacillus catalpae]
MVNLVLNENMKIYRRVRTWVLIGLMAAFVILGNFIMWHEGKSAQGEGWQSELTQEREQWSKQLTKPDLDEELEAFYKERIAVISYQLEHNIHSTQGTMWNGINESASLGILITIFTIIIAGDILAGEFSAGTIKLLLIRPANRVKILLSKYLAMLLFSMVLLLTLFVVSVLLNGILYGFNYIDLPLISLTDGQIVEKSMLLNLWKTYLLNGISTVMYVTITFMISSVFRSSAMSIGFSIGILFAGNILLEVLQRYEWSKYLLFANTDLTQYLEGRPFQDGMTLSFSIGVLVVYFLVFNLISWLMFTRRDVTA